jgi:hypothetical protein
MSMTIRKMLNMDAGTAIDTLEDMYGKYETLPAELDNDTAKLMADVLAEYDLQADTHTTRFLWQSLVQAYQEANNG